MQAVHADGEAHRGQRPAEAPEQVVVAPAAAERLAERRVVDVEHRARVVAQSAREAKVEDDVLGDGVLEQVQDVAQAAQRVGHRTGRRLQHVGSAAQLRHAHEQVGVAGREVELAHLALEADEVLGRELLQQALAVLLVDPEAAQQRRIERGVAEADPVARKAHGV